jgi:hypothetical protein
VTLESTGHNTFPHAPALSCSLACREVHRRCAGCGVFEGPDHFHRLRDGYCYELLNIDEETGQTVAVVIRQSCWVVAQLGTFQGAA